MRAYQGLKPYFGDLHNHCGISYGHGSLNEALLNARQQLDFCSVTGHAFWPDMPSPDQGIQHLVDYHVEGFARLHTNWPIVQRVLEEHHQPGEFVTFLSFEMHSSADGDYTILYNDSHGELLETSGLDELRGVLHRLMDEGFEVLAFPHHIAYQRGQRGINWDTFDSSISPLVEIISMHGCSEADENTRPFLHGMGPSDFASTMRYGLAQGHFFGVIGSTDHHSAHPGSYGHGRTGLWASAKTRSAIWEALTTRRTYALTGDRIELEYTVNDVPMGGQAVCTSEREISFHVVGGAPIDYVDVVRNGDLLRRFSRSDYRDNDDNPQNIHTLLYLELGWGARGVRADWDVKFGISEGRIKQIEPRLRGPEVVDPYEGSAKREADLQHSTCQVVGERCVRIRTTTFGNPNNFTSATQGVCLHVEMPSDASVRCDINGEVIEMPLKNLLEGARSGRLGKITSPCYRLHRAPRLWEYNWKASFEDRPEDSMDGDTYYLRVRQLNDQWAWSSPIRILHD
jgi:hypothetical protein